MGNAKSARKRNPFFQLGQIICEAEIENSSFAMGIWWSADVDVGGVAGHCDERFEDVKRLFEKLKAVKIFEKLKTVRCHQV